MGRVGAGGAGSAGGGGEEPSEKNSPSAFSSTALSLPLSALRFLLEVDLPLRERLAALSPMVAATVLASVPIAASEIQPQESPEVFSFDSMYTYATNLATGRISSRSSCSAVHSGILVILLNDKTVQGNRVSLRITMLLLRSVASVSEGDLSAAANSLEDRKSVV